LINDLNIKTRYGTFNGFVDKNGVKTWLGIPYAQPPVGAFRWQAPQPLKPSNNTFDAQKYGNDPMQASMKLGNLVEGFIYHNGKRRLFDAEHLDTR